MGELVFSHRISIAMENGINGKFDYSDEDIKVCTHDDYTIAADFLREFNRITECIDSNRDVHTYKAYLLACCNMWSELAERYKGYSCFASSPFYQNVQALQSALAQTYEDEISADARKADKNIIDAITGVRALVKGIERINPEYYDMLEESYYV